MDTNKLQDLETKLEGVLSDIRNNNPEIKEIDQVFLSDCSIIEIKYHIGDILVEDKFIFYYNDLEDKK